MLAIPEHILKVTLGTRILVRIYLMASFEQGKCKSVGRFWRRTDERRYNCSFLISFSRSHASIKFPRIVKSSKMKTTLGDFIHDFMSKAVDANLL